MQSNSKRTVQVNVKMSDKDLSTLQKAADALRPDAILTRSGIVLGLAKMAARDALAKSKNTGK
ncbi:MAG TPA: hypothetical protein VKY85_19550 [Candidatus Angelobacter sp.]|nr:hypothetical protein [Candidatus Angelobacter sp.]